MARPTLWLLVASMDNPEAALTIPTLAWMADVCGAQFEMYLEAQRDGRLFARTGSTVLGAMHHQQFNYLCAAFDVKAILLGSSSVFMSSLAVFDVPVIAEGATAVDLYRQLHERRLLPQVEAAVYAPDVVQCGEQTIEIGPYVFPEIYFRRALAFLPSAADAASRLLGDLHVSHVYSLYLDSAPSEKPAGACALDSVQPGDDIGSLTLRLAERWKQRARGVVFGDPPAVLSQLATHCRQQRVAVFAPQKPLLPSRVTFSAYSEQISAIAEDVTRLANEIGNPVIVGRQTGDGDLFAWAKGGVCMQIIDPNRPPFPIVEQIRHVWAKPTHTLYDLEPPDEDLRRYARQGKVLATLLWHSGEVAHNEAMLNVLDLASWLGLKMGNGVHAARYATCPQLWELLNVPRERGGAQGLIEPLLYSGGQGIMAEINCPAEALGGHCRAALDSIRAVAGDAGAPRGYHAFMDAQLSDLTRTRDDVFAAVAGAGLEYMISCATPGRNRIVWQTGRFLAINQSCRVVHGSSPFVRVTTVEDLATSGHTRPGWLIGTLDAPVISFMPYIWRYGSRFMNMADFLLKNDSLINVTPHTIARYARILHDEGYLPSQQE